MLQPWIPERMSGQRSRSSLEGFSNCWSSFSPPPCQVHWQSREDLRTQLSFPLGVQPPQTLPELSYCSRYGDEYRSGREAQWRPLRLYCQVLCIFLNCFRILRRSLTCLILRERGVFPREASIISFLFDANITLSLPSFKSRRYLVLELIL